MSAMFSYDRLAPWYDADMGQRMPFDDCAWYFSLCSRFCGPTLELGCGTGRLLLPLAQRGVNMVGLDRSRAMLDVLEQKRRGLSDVSRPLLIQGDIAALPVAGAFALVLAPYSLISYLLDEVALDRFFRECRRLLISGGALIVDVFVPRSVSYWRVFRGDHEARWQGLTLSRAKKIECLDSGCNRITRRYRIGDEFGSTVEAFETVDVIRAWQQARVVELAMASGFRLCATHYDYDPNKKADASQFVSLVFEVL